MSMAPRIQTKLKKRDAAVVAENTAVNDGANEIPASAEDADGNTSPANPSGKNSRFLGHVKKRILIH